MILTTKSDYGIITIIAFSLYIGGNLIIQHTLKITLKNGKSFKSTISSEYGKVRFLEMFRFAMDSNCPINFGNVVVNANEISTIKYLKGKI